MKTTCGVALLILASLWSVSTSAAAKRDIRIAITVDDLPVHSDLPPGVTRLDVAREVLAALKAAHAPKVYGFVNAVHLQKDPALADVLVAWRAVGYPLGNHTWSHPGLNDRSVEDYADEIIKNETALKQYSDGMAWNWFRYPFLSEGDADKRDAIRTVLSQRGYRIAAVTMSFDDYRWNEPYVRCVSKGDDEAIKLLEKSYLTAAEDAIEHSHTMSTALYGRDIPYVLLIHIGGFDAHMMSQLLAMYKAKGVRLITLEQAEKDAAYASDVTPSLPPEPAGLPKRMKARGLTVPAEDLQLTVMLSKICK